MIIGCLVLGHIEICRQSVLLQMTILNIRHWLLLMPRRISDGWIMNCPENIKKLGVWRNYKPRRSMIFSMVWRQRLWSDIIWHISRWIIRNIRINCMAMMKRRILIRWFSRIIILGEKDVWDTTKNWCRIFNCLTIKGLEIIMWPLLPGLNRLSEIRRLPGCMLFRRLMRYIWLIMRRWIHIMMRVMKRRHVWGGCSVATMIMPINIWLNFRLVMMDLGNFRLVIVGDSSLPLLSVGVFRKKISGRNPSYRIFSAIWKSVDHTVWWVTITFPDMRRSIIWAVITIRMAVLLLMGNIR